MNESLTRKINLFGAWSLICYAAMLFIGWLVVAPFFPLVKPSAGAEEVVALIRGHVFQIRLGMVIVMWGSAFFIPFTASFADCISKVEGRNGPLTRIVTMSGYANAMLSFYPPFWWIASTWRAQERPVDIIYMLSDVAWLQFMGGLALDMPFFIVVAVIAFVDKAADPTFPRWFGYASLLAFVLEMPDQMLFFFTSGPFAWNGLIACWLPIFAFFLWFIGVFYFMRRNILRDMRAH